MHLPCNNTTRPTSLPDEEVPFGSATSGKNKRVGSLLYSSSFAYTMSTSCVAMAFAVDAKQNANAMHDATRTCLMFVLFSCE